jgi:hypothetical protein
MLVQTSAPVAEVGGGTVEVGGSSSENVVFQSGASGALQLDHASAYTGKVSGFGAPNHSGHQSIELTGVNYVSGVVTETYSGTSAGGVLTVTSSGGSGGGGRGKNSCGRLLQEHEFRADVRHRPIGSSP